MVIFWFRRDLRLEDNHGLYQALISAEKVLPVFIFDPAILKQFNNKNDFRLSYIFHHLNNMHSKMTQSGGAMHWVFQSPIEFFKKAIKQFNITAIHCNEDYEPAALLRDKQVESFLNENGIAFYKWKDQVIFNPKEILKPDFTAYKIFTPYSKVWKSKLLSNRKQFIPFPSENFLNRLALVKDVFPHLSLCDIGYNLQNIEKEKLYYSNPDLKLYHLKRDYPFENAGSGASVHLRFGTISIRKLIQSALALNDDAFLNELIWREFYFSIIFHFPFTTESAFKSAYDRIEWKWNESHFKSWCDGNTGFPFVDAGMRQLNATGEMHNRLRMICASFLCKNLLHDWRLGEAYFAQKLNDFDKSANVGGWQWAAGSGCDAAPYFRIFNPSTQVNTYDPELKFVRKWIPELNTTDYPQAIINLEESRKLCLRTYQQALKEI